jgi:hypothetical protein
MERSVSNNKTMPLNATILTLTEQQLQQWLELMDYLRDSHAPTDQVTFCRRQIVRLQKDLYQLRNKESSPESWHKTS